MSDESVDQLNEYAEKLLGSREQRDALLGRLVQLAEDDELNEHTARVETELAHREQETEARLSVLRARRAQAPEKPKAKPGRKPGRKPKPEATGVSNGHTELS